MKIIPELIDAAIKLRAERFKEAAQAHGVEVQVQKTEGGYECVVDGTKPIERHIAKDSWIDQAIIDSGGGL